MDKMRDLARGRALKKGGEMRAQAMAMAAQRKEEFLGARVPKALRDKVMQRAELEGVPVSLFIRNILEDLFKDVAQTSSSNNQPKQAAPMGTLCMAERFASVLGWEDIRLNRAVPCSGCAGPLAQGMLVTLGLGMQGGAHVVLCQECKNRLT